MNKKNLDKLTPEGLNRKVLKELTKGGNEVLKYQNKWGNFELHKRSVPEDCILVNISANTLRSLGVEYLTCVNGFKKYGARWSPIKDGGFLIHKNDLPIIQHLLNK